MRQSDGFEPGLRQVLVQSGASGGSFTRPERKGERGGGKGVIRLVSGVGGTGTETVDRKTGDGAFTCEPVT